MDVLGRASWETLQIDMRRQSTEILTGFNVKSHDPAIRKCKLRCAL
jgi:hypothetical protein